MNVALQTLPSSLKLPTLPASFIIIIPTLLHLFSIIVFLQGGRTDVGGKGRGEARANRQIHTYTQTHTNASTHTHTHAHKNHTQTHTHTSTNTHTHTHTKH